jgi:hypothetical protein
MRGEFRPISPRPFGQLGLNCHARGKAGFRSDGARWGINGSTGVPMTKLMAVAAFFAAVYAIDPSVAGTIDSQMRVLAWKINSALDVRPFLRG